MLVARFTTPPTNTRKALIDNLVGALKAGGVWAKLDALYVMAAADEQAARRNWIADSNNLVAVNSPTFTADRGFAGDGSTSYLDTLLANNGATHFTQNDGYLGSWATTSVDSDTQIDVGGGNAYINSRNAAGNFACRANFGGGVAGAQTRAVASSTGWSSWSRRSSTAFDMLKNGAKLGTQNAGTEALNTATFTMGKAGTSYSTRQLAAYAIGGGAMSNIEDAALYAALLAYMQSVGAA